MLNPEPRLDSSTAILDTSRQLSTARQPRQQLSSCQVDSFSTASRQLDSDATLQSCQGCQAVNSTARQLDSSTARQLRLGLPCMNWWLHLIRWLNLRSIHQGRCPLTSVAIKGVHIGISIPCTVIPPIRGYHVETPWRCPLRSDGVPPTHWVAHQGRYHVHGGGQEDASSWGNPPDTYMTTSCRQRKSSFSFR